MSSLTELNTYSLTTVNYDTTDVQINITANVAFTLPYITWVLARTIGSVSPNGAIVTITHPATTTFSFPNIAQAENTLTVTTVSSTITTISGMKQFQDWAASYAVATSTVATATITVKTEDIATSANITIVVDCI